jgi:hypothetical protein
LFCIISRACLDGNPNNSPKKPAKTAEMISLTKRVLLVKEIKEAGDGFGESSDQKSAAF